MGFWGDSGRELLTGSLKRVLTRGVQGRVEVGLAYLGLIVPSPVGQSLPNFFLSKDQLLQL